MRYISDNFEVVEELLDLLQLITTIGDIFNALKIVIEATKVEWAKLDSIYTDGVPLRHI